MFSIILAFYFSINLYYIHQNQKCKKFAEILFKSVSPITNFPVPDFYCKAFCIDRSIKSEISSRIEANVTAQYTCRTIICENGDLIFIRLFARLFAHFRRFSSLSKKEVRNEMIGMSPK